VYKHFGRAVIAAQLGQPEGSPDVETVYLAVYKHFMEAIDGIDNGEVAYERLFAPLQHDRTVGRLFKPTGRSASGFALPTCHTAVPAHSGGAMLS
jgi:uncharacterized UPF0160 family protein